MKILHLDSSIQGDTSVSRLLSAAVVERLRATHETTDPTYRDLAIDPLPHLTLPGLATDLAATVLDEFLDSDIVVIGAPMYNFGIATQLKSWFDHILVANRTFRYGESGVEGLAGGKTVIVAISRGGIYSEGPAISNEHAESHLRAMLGLIGIPDAAFVIAEGVAYGPAQREAALQAAQAQIDRILPLPVAA
jgi:FMN-dependent NADH-azoreductase